MRYSFFDVIFSRISEAVEGIGISVVAKLKDLLGFQPEVEKEP